MTEGGYPGGVPPRDRGDALTARLWRPLSLRRTGLLPGFPPDEGAAAVRLDFSARALRPGRFEPAGSCTWALSSGTGDASSGSSTTTGLASAGAGAATAGCHARRLRGTGRRQPSSSASYRARYRRSLRMRRSCDVPRSMGGERASVRTATAEATVAPTATPTHPLSTQPMDPAIRTANMALNMGGSVLRGHHPFVRNLARFVLLGAPRSVEGRRHPRFVRVHITLSQPRHAARRQPSTSRIDVTTN